MIRISYFTDLGSAERTGGGQTFARELFTILDELPVALSVFSAYYPAIDRRMPFDSPKIQTISLASKGTFGMPTIGIRWSFELYRRMKTMPVQNLYVFDQPSTWFAMLPKVPAVTMFHGTDFVKLKDLSFFRPRSSAQALLWQKPVLNRVQRGFLTRELGVPLFNSRYTLNLLGKDFDINTEPLENFITYLPVDTRSYAKDLLVRKSVREHLHIAEDDVVIAYLSNFAPKKRPDRIPAIVASFFEKLPEAKVKFLFVGRGIASGPIDALTETPRFKGRCIRIGEVAPSEVQKFYSAADIALSTSESETFGYFVAEGMAAQLPFVAYAEGAVPEVVENGRTGFLVNDEGEFADVLVRLVKDKELRMRMGKAGEERVRNLFSRAAFKERFVNILRKEFRFEI